MFITMSRHQLMVFNGGAHKYATMPEQMAYYVGQTCGLVVNTRVTSRHGDGIAGHLRRRCWRYRFGQWSRYAKR